jgi:hypothetical protein
VTKKAATEKKNDVGAPGYTEQVAHFRSKMLDLIPQGWTVREVLTEPGMCSMTYFFATLLPGDLEFQKQYARACIAE